MFKHHLVSWNVVCSPVKDGGLGICRMVDFNKALLGKWLWRFGLEEHRLWRCVLVAKYGDRDAFVASVLSRLNGGVEWNVTFIRNFNDWEMDAVTAFLHLLYSHSPVSMNSDILWWRLKKNGLFDISSFYHAIRNVCV
uniref:Reverse transcriptase zinc-binding domain-containing protein n=1 Tax=Fagus sylvatica TaxID=28930 RepID=A0A2N9IGI4_FAGSY